MTHGPVQIWQEYFGYNCMPTPRIRLIRAEKYGLLVGRQFQSAGALRIETALRYEYQGIAYLVRDENGKVLKAYACQLSFDFCGPPPWQTWKIYK